MSKQTAGLPPYWRWLPLALVALWPFGVAYEAVILTMNVLAWRHLSRDGWHAWRALPHTLKQAVLVLFATWWLPQFLSFPDAANRTVVLAESALDLRYLGVLLFFALLSQNRTHLGKWLNMGLAALIGLWCLDALIQWRFGIGLGGALNTDRVSGIFGDGNLKLGASLAAVSSFALYGVLSRWGGWLAALFAALLAFIVLLAGARAAWVSLFLVCLLTFLMQASRWQTMLLRAALLVVVAVGTFVLAQQTSERFAERVARSQAALQGDYDGINHALSGRLSIFETAINMYQSHPINGLGARSFRDHYSEFAEANDPFVAEGGGFHAHHWVLEVASEMGTLGLLCWLAGLVWLIRHHLKQSTPQRSTAQPAAIAMIVFLWPLNTHSALYSSYWAMVWFWMAGMWLVGLHANDENPKTPNPTNRPRL